MKLTKLYIGLLCGMAALSSCNDFLDREPLDEITPENFLYNESDLASYAINLYPFSTHSGWDIAGIWDNDNNTDNLAGTGYSTIWTPGQWRTPETDGNWEFTTIRQCNYFLNIVQPRYDNGEISGSNAGHYLGEVYFLRAYNYFGKLQALGDFPIITETLDNDTEILIAASKRQPRNKVARFILEDWDRAIALLSNNPDGGKNRITKNAALLFKSRVALFEASWETYHKGTAFVPGGSGWPGDPNDLSDFNIDTEISFFLTQCKDAAKQVADAIPLADNTAANVDLWDNTEGDAQYKMNNPYYAQFCDENLESYPEILLWRAYNYSEYSIGHSAVFYLYNGGNTGFNRNYVETFLFRDGKPIYAHPEYTDTSIKNVRKDRDSRLQLFMMTPGEMVGYNESDHTTKVYLTTPLNLLDGTRKANTGYMLRKGLGDTWYREGNYGTEGCPVFRASEAYLNYLEASCIENGGNSIDGTAQNYWKQLRKRAGLPEDYMITVNATVYPGSAQEAVTYKDGPQTFETDWAVYSKGEQVSKLLYNIRRERRCELIEEGLRMMDLKRWRALDQLNYKDFPDEGYRVSGMNLWEPEELAEFPEGTLKGEGEEDGPNISGKTNSGKYLCPYRAVANHYLYNRGYKWCEAHYLSPIGVKNFRQTASNLEDLNTSVIYQNPGWAIEVDAPPIGVPAQN